MEDIMDMTIDADNANGGEWHCDLFGGNMVRIHETIRRDMPDRIQLMDHIHSQSSLVV